MSLFTKGEAVRRQRYQVREPEPELQDPSRIYTVSASQTGVPVSLNLRDRLQLCGHPSHRQAYEKAETLAQSPHFLPKGRLQLTLELPFPFSMGERPG